MGLIGTLPDLKAIAFNGGTAAKLGVKAVAAASADIERITLPSSSSAHAALSVEGKTAAWLALRRPLGITTGV